MGDVHLPNSRNSSSSRRSMIRCSNNNNNSSSRIKKEVELHIISAQNLKAVGSGLRFLWCCCYCAAATRTRAYAVASIDRNDAKFVTPVDREGGSNPSWNAILSLGLDDELLDNPIAGLTVEIYHSGLLCDKLVGSVRILLCDLVKSDRSGGKCFTYMVLRPSGRRQGLLNVGIAAEDEHDGDEQQCHRAAL